MKKSRNEDMQDPNPSVVMISPYYPPVCSSPLAAEGPLKAFNTSVITPMLKKRLVFMLHSYHAMLPRVFTP